jgi:predicted  nucleic acid-binding Zn-ribbon protein
MMNEQRTLIELTDIIGVEFECAKCGAKVLYPLAKHYNRILSQCPNCNENWLDYNPKIHPADPQLNQQVVNIIAQLRSLGERPDLHAHVRVHVSNQGQESKKPGQVTGQSSECG